MITTERREETGKRLGESEGEASRRIPWRAIVLGLVLLPATCYWAQDQIMDRIFSLMIPPVAVTLAVIVVNLAWKRLSPRTALTQGELLVFYGMQAVACAMASEWIDYSAPLMYGYAIDPDRDTRTYVLPYLSHWLFFTNSVGLQNFAAGHASHFLSDLPLWAPKVLAWTLLAGILAFAMFCVNSLMIDQWANRERFSFPLVQLPLAMTERGGQSTIWKSRILWGCFAVVFSIDMLNGLAFLYPQLPTVPVRFLTPLGNFDDVSQWFALPPFNQIGWTPLGIFPFIVGIGLLMPTDLLFSCLFFFFFRKVEQVIVASLGYPTDLFGGGSPVPSAPYFSEQSWGAFLGLFAGAVWAARPYLRELWSDIKSGARLGADRIPPRFALIGLVVSLVALGLLGIAIGLPFLYVILYMIVFLVFSVVITRLQAQLGVPTHEMGFMGPNQLFVDFHGTQGVPPALIANSIPTFYFLNRIHRTDPMPTQLEAMYLADRSRVRAGGMFAALIVAAIAGALIGRFVEIYVNYGNAKTYLVGESTGVVSGIVQNPRGINPSAIAAIAAGFLFVLALDAIRYRFVGFPLHPAGFALAMNFGLDYYWFGLMIALIVKFATQRYTGLPGLQKLRMAAFGLILGEFAAETVWAIFSMTHHDQLTYTVSIGSRMGWAQ